MNISKSTRYALYAAAEMASAQGGPTTVAAVAARYRIPEGALAKVFQQLVRVGMAAGRRGVGGGYRLARPASSITVLDIVRAFEPPYGRGECLLHDGPGEACPDGATCRLQWLFTEVDELVDSTYEAVTLATLERRPAGSEARPVGSTRRSQSRPPA